MLFTAAYDIWMVLVETDDIWMILARADDIWMILAKADDTWMILAGELELDRWYLLELRISKQY
jgi:hypothetical protein